MLQKNHLKMDTVRSSALFLCTNSRTACACQVLLEKSERSAAPFSQMHAELAINEHADHAGTHFGCRARKLLAVNALVHPAVRVYSRDGGRIGAAALPAVEGGDRNHILIRDYEIMHIQVAGHAPLV